MLRKTCLLISVLLCASCAQLDSSQPLLKPMYAAELIAYQHLTLTYEGKQEYFDIAMQIQSGQLKTVLMTEFSQPLLSIDFDGSHLEIEERPFLHKPPISAQQLLRDLQLILWPAAELQQALSSSGLTLELSENGRRLSKKGRIMAEVVYDTPCPWQGRSHLTRLHRNYSLQLQSTLEIEQTPNSHSDEYCPPL